MDDTSKFYLQTHVVSLKSELDLIAYDLDQLNSRIRFLGKRQSEKYTEMIGILHHLEQSYSATKVDVDMRLYGECDPDQLQRAKDSMNLLYPEKAEQSTSLAIGQIENGSVKHG